MSRRKGTTVLLSVILASYLPLSESAAKAEPALRRIVVRPAMLRTTALMEYFLSVVFDWVEGRLHGETTAMPLCLPQVLFLFGDLVLFASVSAACPASTHLASLSL